MSQLTLELFASKDAVPEDVSLIESCSLQACNSSTFIHDASLPQQPSPKTSTQIDTTMLGSQSIASTHKPSRCISPKTISKTSLVEIPLWSSPAIDVHRRIRQVSSTESPNLPAHTSSNDLFSPQRKTVTPQPLTHMLTATKTISHISKTTSSMTPLITVASLQSETRDLQKSVRRHRRDQEVVTPEMIADVKVLT